MGLQVDSGHNISTGSGSGYALGKHKGGDVTVFLQSEPYNSVNVATWHGYWKKNEPMIDGPSPQLRMAAILWCEIFS